MNFVLKSLQLYNVCLQNRFNGQFKNISHILKLSMCCLHVVFLDSPFLISGTLHCFSDPGQQMLVLSKNSFGDHHRACYYLENPITLLLSIFKCSFAILLVKAGSPLIVTTTVKGWLGLFNIESSGMYVHSACTQIPVPPHGYVSFIITI